MIDGILGWMGTKYGERGTERHPGELSTYSAMLWNRLRTEGSNFGQPVNYGHGMFSVRTGTSSQVSVDLVARTCSCLEFQEMQFPCVHAVKCIDRSEVARSSAMHSAYLAQNVRDCYAMPLRPVPILGIQARSDLRQCEAPEYRRPAGRPRTRRIRRWDQSARPSRPQRRQLLPIRRRRRFRRNQYRNISLAPLS